MDPLSSTNSLARSGDQLRGGAEAEFRLDVDTMRLDGFPADAHPIPDVLSGQPVADELKNLELTVGQPGDGRDAGGIGLGW
jgi:hypothetical protein